MKLISTALLAAGFASLAACGGGAANNAAANNSAEPPAAVEEPNVSEPVANEPLPPPAEPGNGSNEAAGNGSGNAVQ